MRLAFDASNRGFKTSQRELSDPGERIIRPSATTNVQESKRKKNPQFVRLISCITCSPRWQFYALKARVGALPPPLLGVVYSEGSWKNVLLGFAFGSFLLLHTGVEVDGDPIRYVR